MGELGTHLAYRKSECWKLSAYSCARRSSIPTMSSTGVARRYPSHRGHGHKSVCIASTLRLEKEARYALDCS